VGLPAREAGQRGVDRVARVGAEDDVARVDEREREMRDGLLGADHADGLADGMDGDAEAALHEAGGGAAKRLHADVRRVAVGPGIAAASSQRLDDVGRRRQVGIADAEIDEVAPLLALFGLERVDAGEQVRRELTDAVSQLDLHGRYLPRGAAPPRRPAVAGRRLEWGVGKSRLEAFSDGVIAILITILVLELKVPRGVDLQALRPLWPVFATYVMSFVYLGIYWNNHHHMLHAVHQVNGRILWANLHLLFWLSLVPFVTGWMGENHFAALPTAVYGAVLLLAAVAYTLLQHTIVRHQGPESKLRAAVGRDFKGKLSMVLYLIAIPSAFLHRGISNGIYALVAIIWVVPDPRIESRLNHH